MDETDKLIKRIDELLTCSICLSRYKSPKTLPCNHTYCADCLNNLIEHDNIICPLCRKLHILADRGVRYNIINDNLTINGFLELNFNCIKRTNRINENSKYFEEHIRSALNQLYFVDLYLKKLTDNKQQQQQVQSKDDKETTINLRNIDSEEGDVENCRLNNTNDSCATNNEENENDNSNSDNSVFNRIKRKLMKIDYFRMNLLLLIMIIFSTVLIILTIIIRTDKEYIDSISMQTILPVNSTAPPTTTTSNRRLASNLFNY